MDLNNDFAYSFTWAVLSFSLTLSFFFGISDRKVTNEKTEDFESFSLELSIHF